MEKRLILRLTALLAALIFGTVLLIWLSTVDVFSTAIAYITNSQSFINDVWQNQTQAALESVTGNEEADTLILGDSVTEHLFYPLQADNPRYLITAGNAGFLLIGQYALASEFILSHPNAKKIILILRAPSFNAVINSKYSYSFSI